MGGTTKTQLRLVPPADAARVRGERGSFAIWEITPQIYATEVVGFMTTEMSRMIMQRGETMYARGRTVYGLHNWLGMANYESACRVELTTWVLRHRSQTVLHIALESRMVAMGVAVANLALGNLIRIHNSLASLETALVETLRAPS